jgi:hypothetical protein
VELLQTSQFVGHESQLFPLAQKLLRHFITQVADCLKYVYLQVVQVRESLHISQLAGQESQLFPLIKYPISHFVTQLVDCFK